MKKTLYRAYPHLRPISNYSYQVAKRLFQVYPQWLPCATAETFDNETYLVITVAAPVSASEHDLLITTNRERVTVHFERCHAHFGGWQGSVLDDDVRAAIAFLEAIFREEYVAVGRIQDVPSLGKGFYQYTSLPAALPGEQLYVRSWHGRYNTILVNRDSST
jgi:hypothetical protein